VNVQLIFTFAYLKTKSVTWKSRGSTVGIVTSLGQDGSCFQTPAGEKNISFLQRGLALGPTRHSIRWVPVFLPGVKQPEREVNHLPPSRAEVRNSWIYISTPLVCRHGVDTEKVALMPLSILLASSEFLCFSGTVLHIRYF